MTITGQQRDDLQEAARPLLRWLNRHCHLHCKVVVDCGSVLLVEDVARLVCVDYVDPIEREGEG